MSATAARAVVLFDLDDTLMAHREAVATGIVDHMLERAYEGDVEAAQRLWHALEEEHYHSYLDGRMSFEGQRRARARDFARAHGDVLDDPASGAWFDRYFERYRDAWALHGDALPALDRLRRAFPGVRFGIITNGESDFQRAKLERLGILDRFEHVIASGALGVTKPDRRIFEHAIASFAESAPVSHVAYVGDRLGTDALGAAAAGLDGVWIDRWATPVAPAEASAIAAAGVVVITGLDELAPRLSELWAHRTHPAPEGAEARGPAPEERSANG
ncbi:HAD family hydrolase [Agromyces salentinus]|uniref:HAD family hydrolase n=1 Tax=Agromyces salentinus TaxID=269421 RepID=A0ABP4Z7E0_9MICO|nr:HAD family hydrolase [Agromyces salentinus]